MLFKILLIDMLFLFVLMELGKNVGVGLGKLGVVGDNGIFN